MREATQFKLGEDQLTVDFDLKAAYNINKHKKKKKIKNTASTLPGFNFF